MNVDSIYELIKICLTEGLIIMAPVVVTALAIGVLVSIVQTVTSIQEQTLTFVPKLLGAVASLWIFAPWMMHRVSALVISFIQKAGEIAK